MSMDAWLLVVLAVVAPTSASDGDYLYIEGKDHIGALVHLMEWSYEDIKNECAFLKRWGYHGILISPPTEHVMLDKSSMMERYMTISLKLETRSGTMEQLKDMIENCASRSFRVYVDINLNSMLKSTTEGTAKGIAGSKATPKEHSYEGFTKKEFHKSCKLTAKDMNNPDKVRVCEYEDLQDLDNNSETLQDKHVALMNQLIDMGVTGFRVVFAKYMYPKHLRNMYLQLKEITKMVTIEKPLMIHDINDLERGVVKADQYKEIGTYTDYDYAKLVSKYFLKDKSRDLDALFNYVDLTRYEPLRPREKEPMVFLYNHLTQHSKEPYILTPEKGKPYKMAMAFMLSWPIGIPMILSSYNGDEGAPQYRNGNVMSPRPEGVSAETGDYKCISQYNCEHRDPAILRMVRFNQEVRNEPLTKLNGNNKTHWFAFGRGDKGFIFFNVGEKNMNKTFKNLELRSGEYCDIASGDIEYNECTGRTIFIDEDASANIVLDANDPYGYVAIHPRTRVHASIRFVKAVVSKNEHVAYLASAGGSAIAYGGKMLGNSLSRTAKVMKDPNANPHDVLEAAMGKTGSQMVIVAGAALGSAAKNIATQAARKVAEGAAQEDATAKPAEETATPADAQSNPAAATKHS